MSDDGSELVQFQQRTPFTMIDNPIIRSMDDYVALGLYVDMLSHKSGWKIDLRQLARTHKQGRIVLQSAMNFLISRGLLFRVRYQSTTGTWSTRTYVCSSPVTAVELGHVRSSYTGRCVFQSTDALNLVVNGSDHQPVENSQPAAEPASKPLVTPNARFLAAGELAAGSLAAGEPAAGNLAPKRLEDLEKIPLHPPTDGAAETAESKPEEEESKNVQTNRPEVAAVLDALVDAWPRLGQNDLNQLEPDVGQALEHVPRAKLVEHLTENTGGVNRPASVIRARLANLPATTRHTRRALPTWCGSCHSPEYRWVDHDEGTTSPCPRCSPQAMQRGLVA